MAFDYSSSFGGINNAIANFGRQNELAYQRQTLASLGQKIQSGDYGGAAQAAFAAGDANTGIGLLKLGQSQQQLNGQNAISAMFTGGGRPASLSAVGQPAPALGSPNDVENSFISGVKGAGLTNPIGLGAVAAYGKAESSYAPQNVNRSWNDPSQSGQAGTAGGIMSWRADRLQNLQRFAASRGEQGNGSPATQALFLAQEDPTLIPKLQAAQSPQEANQIMANAWRFAGYNQPGGENARRLALTQAYAQRYGGQGGPAPAIPVQVAENEADVQRLEAQQGNPVVAAQAQAADPEVSVPGYAGTWSRAKIAAAPDGTDVPDDNELAKAQGGARGVQVAQAAPQPGAPQADVPAPGAREAGFNPPGNGMPPNDPVPHLSTQQLIGIAMNPNATDGQRSMAKTIIDARQKYSDENAPDKREMIRLDLQKKRQEVEANATPLTPEERQQFGIPDNVMAYRKSNGDLGFAPAGTNINLPGAEKASEGAYGKIEGEALGNIYKAGANAGKRLQILNIAENAYKQGGDNISSGPSGSIILKGKQALSNMLGIDIKGLPESEIIQKIGTQLASESLKALTNRGSQMEFGVFLQNNPGLLMSNKGALFMISILKQQAQQERDLARLVSNPDNRKNWFDVQDKYENDHPIISPFTGKPIDNSDMQTLQSAAGAGGGATVPAPSPSTTGGAPSPNQRPDGSSPPAPSQAAPPVAGARQAPDGKFYVPDPSRPGKYLQVQ